MSGPTFRASRFTLGVKLSVFVVALVLVVSASMAYFLVYRSAVDKERAMEKQVRSMAGFFSGIRSHGYESSYDPALVRELVRFGVKVGANISFVVFSDASGKVEGGSVNHELLEEAAPELARSLKALPQGEQLARLSEWHWDTEYIHPFSVRLKSKDGSVLGRVQMGFSTVELRKNITASVYFNLGVTLVAFLLGTVVALMLARHFARPIREVVAAMQGVSAGQLDQTLAVRSRDEVGILARSFNYMTQGLRERERIRGTLARYVSDQVAERILREEDEVGLEGELKHITVLFLDIRGFTTVAEYLHPQEVVGLLNDYFEIIIEIIFQHEGTINKFIGDSIMAIYGAPSAIDRPELRGVLTAVLIQKAIGEFNWRRMQDGRPVVNFGIGVHSGEAIAGNIGSARRMEYTVIGRDVNLAQRIENATREGQILISEHTYRKVSELVEVQQKEAVFMKGILEPIPLYEVTGMKIQSLDEAPEGASQVAGGQS